LDQFDPRAQVRGFFNGLFRAKGQETATQAYANGLGVAASFLSNNLPGGEAALKKGADGIQSAI